MIALPTEVPASKAHQIPRAVFFESLAVGKNSGESGHASPKAQQQEMKAQIQNEEKDRAAEIKARHREKIARVRDGECGSIEK